MLDLTNNLVDKHLIFGLNDLGKTKQYASVIVVNNNENNDLSIHLGTPGIINSTLDEKHTNVLFTFPVYSDRPPNRIDLYKTSDLKRKSHGCFLDNHKFINALSFGPKRIAQAIKLTKENSAVSFVMSKQTAVSFLQKLIPLALDRYKYHSVFHTFYNNNIKSYVNIVPGDCAISVVSFLDIRHCIPIFNTRRVDGVGIIFRTILPLTSKKDKMLIEIAEMSVILSQFKENLFCIDGTDMCPHITITNELICKMIDVTECGIGINDKKKAKHKEKTKDSWIPKYETKEDGNTLVTISYDNVPFNTYTTYR